MKCKTQTQSFQSKKKGLEYARRDIEKARAYLSQFVGEDVAVESYVDVMPKDITENMHKPLEEKITEEHFGTIYAFIAKAGIVAVAQRGILAILHKDCMEGGNNHSNNNDDDDDGVKTITPNGIIIRKQIRNIVSSYCKTCNVFLRGYGKFCRCGNKKKKKMMYYINKPLFERWNQETLQRIEEAIEIRNAQKDIAEARHVRVAKNNNHKKVRLGKLGTSAIGRVAKPEPIKRSPVKAYNLSVFADEDIATGMEGCLAISLEEATFRDIKEIVPSRIDKDAGHILIGQNIASLKINGKRYEGTISVDLLGGEQ